MLSDQLDFLMELNHINKNVLSRETGIPYTTIDSFYKKGCGNVKLSTLQKLAAYFGVTLDFLVGDPCERRGWDQLQREDAFLYILERIMNSADAVTQECGGMKEFIKRKNNK